MKFIPSRELRLRPGQVWRDLKKEGELVVTSHGQPVALMLPVNGKDLETKLGAVRAAELRDAIRALQQDSVRKGLDKLTMEEIDEIIRQVRQEHSL